MNLKGRIKVNCPWCQEINTKAYEIIMLLEDGDSYKFSCVHCDCKCIIIYLNGVLSIVEDNS